MKTNHLLSLLLTLMMGAASAQPSTNSLPIPTNSVASDEFEQIKARAENGDAEAQYKLCALYVRNKGDLESKIEGIKWCRRSAEQGYVTAQFNLGMAYMYGDAVPQDYIKAYKWFCIAAIQDHAPAIKKRDELATKMFPSQLAEAQALGLAFVPKKENTNRSRPTSKEPFGTGTGFFITDDGYLISNHHVVKDATKVQVVTSAGTVAAKVIQTDAANDLALLKVEGKFSALPIAPSRKVLLGSTVATVGFPDPSLQGFSPKLAKGEIASLSGAADDARYFQISVPVQPGNSGGALVEEHGNVVGIVSAKLNARAALESSGSLPENVNYAVKSSYLLSFLESVPAVASQLKEPSTKEQKFEDVVKTAQAAAALILVY